MIATLSKQANRIFFLVLCTFPLLPPNWISLACILMLMSGVLHVSVTRQCSFNWAFFLPVAGIIAPYIIWLLASDYLMLGVQTVQVRLMLVGVPLAFSFKALELSEKEQEYAFSVFSMASVIIVLYSNCVMSINGFTHPVGIQGADLAYSYRVSLEYYSGLHPTYYCAIVYTAAFIQLYRLLTKALTARWQYALAITTFIVCTAGGIAAASRAPFAAFLLIVISFIIIQLKSHPKRWILLGIMVLGCVSLFLTPMVQSRLQEMNTANMKAPQGHNDNGTNVRSGIIRCDAQLLKENWLWGLGTGNIQNELNTCLGQYNTPVYKKFNYNTHNEYLNIWITTGIIGFIVWLICLGYPIVRSIRQKHWLHVYFMVFMCFCFVTENYLDRQMGVTFFAMMQTLFFFKMVKTA